MRTAARFGLVVGGASAFTTAFFLVLPLIQAISDAPRPDALVRTVETADVPPPPPPPEEEPEREEPPEEQPPELAEEAPPLDLSQLELALDPGFGDGGMAGDFAVRLGALAGAAGDDVDALFAMDDLDQPPRPRDQPSPVVSAKVRERAPGTVWILFVVDAEGRVQDPVVQKSTDPVFDAPALAAVRRWTFEPGTRAGKPVRTRMRVPITFPES